MKPFFSRAVLALAFSILAAEVAPAFAQGPAFTYQGRLSSGSSAFTGVAEVQPTLWDAESGGTQVAGNDPTSMIINVTNGLFVLPLDFGSAPFAGGADRWLQIQLRTTLGPYTTLTPRQKLTATPYALRAGNAATATTAATANSVAAANITGTLGLAQLPGTVLTNGSTSVNLAGSFSGNGGALSNLSATALVTPMTNVSIASWGRSDYGQRAVPSSLDGAHILAVSPGAVHSLALKADGTVAAWGAGQTNDPSNGIDMGQSIVPAGLANVRAISAGYLHSLALRADRTVVGWGWNDFNQTDVPPTLNSVIEIGAAAYHNIALKADGTLVTWGTNVQGQLDNPPGLNDVKAVSAGFYHNLALRSNGTVVVWGGLDYGQTNMPAGLNDIMAVAAGGAHSLVLRSNGTVAAWGAGQTNDAGAGTGADYGQSIVPAGLNDVVAIAAGVYHSLALKADGTVVAWGSTQFGEANVPEGMNNVVAIGKGASGLHVMALRRRASGPVAWLDSDNTFNGSIKVNGDARVGGEMTAGSLRLSDGNLFLRGGTDVNNALGWHGPGKSFGGVEPDGPVLFGARGGALGTAGTNGHRVALSWNDVGDVSIGSAFGVGRLLLHDDGSGGVGLRGSGNALRMHINGSGGRFAFLNAPEGTEVMTIHPFSGSANVGIGTGSAFPNARLEVRGDVRLGSTGQFLAPGGHESLRIIRGVVSSSGTILEGTGFSVTRTAVGAYTITFTTSFSGMPTVTVTAQAGIPRLPTCTNVGNGSAQIRIFDPTVLVDAQFHFVVTGPR